MKKIPLTKNQFTLYDVNDSDYGWLNQWKWFVNDHNEVVRWLRNQDPYQVAEALAQALAQAKEEGRREGAERVKAKVLIVCPENDCCSCCEAARRTVELAVSNLNPTKD